MTKLAKCTFPKGLGPNDFKAYGPAATKDTEFAGTRLADFGCMQQETVDSNKFYFCCMATGPSKNWYVYIEYGRVGATKPQFQFIECGSEVEAQKIYEAQCAEKNTKRGQWVNIGNLKLFRPKPGKDLYVVQKLASRSYGLPDAKNITASNQITKVIKKSNSYRCDPQTTQLFRDLLGGAVTYARTTLQGGTIPTEAALDEGQDLLQAAKGRLANVGDDVEAQVADNDLKQITYALYSSIPKVKPLGAAESSWILSKDNIFGWEQDIQAFRTALVATDVQEMGDDPLTNVPADMEWVEPKSELGQYLLKWWPNATRRKHHYGAMKIKNLWKIDRHGEKWQEVQKDILKKMPGKWNNERPMHQDKARFDLSTEDRKVYWDSNTGLVFHGSRSINLPGIIKDHFRVPKELTGVVITGAMFGGFGVYIACDWAKSAGYSSLPNSYWSGGGGAVKGRQAFMFACDAIMGVPYVAPGAKGYTGPPAGHHSIFGKAGVSGVQNNEWVAHPRQIKIRYLAEFSC